MRCVNCEKLIAISLPAIRAALVARLSSGGMRQDEIAERLGVTQALVSKYLHRRYSSRVRALSAAIAGSDKLGSIAKRVEAGTTVSDANAMIDEMATSASVADAAARLFGKSVLE